MIIDVKQFLTSLTIRLPKIHYSYIENTGKMGGISYSV